MKRNVLIAGAVGLVVVILAWYFIVYSPIGDDLTADGRLPEGVDRVLSKPVSSDDLRRAIFEVAN